MELSEQEIAAAKSRWLAPSRLDLNVAYEAKQPAPVYFRNLEQLFKYTSRKKLVIWPIPDVSADKALELDGLSGFGPHYRHVWVKVRTGQTDTRKAMINAMMREYSDMPGKVAGLVQADHLCNKASVEHNPDGWLLIFPTISRVNSMAGAIFERALQVDPNVDTVTMTALHFFKLNSEFWPADQAQFEVAMRVIAGQHMNNKMVDKVGRLVADRLGYQWPIGSLSQSDERPQA